MCSHAGVVDALELAGRHGVGRCRRALRRSSGARPARARNALSVAVARFNGQASRSCRAHVIAGSAQWGTHNWEHTMGGPTTGGPTTGAGGKCRSQSRLSRSRLDPAWSLQECRWAPYVRGHDPGQGQLPCESYRPPGQLLETHPAALLADTYVLFAKNQSTWRRERAPAARTAARPRQVEPSRGQVRQSFALVQVCGSLCPAYRNALRPAPIWGGPARRRAVDQSWPAPASSR
jgi:hypothetical protein